MGKRIRKRRRVSFKACFKVQLFSLLRSQHETDGFHENVWSKLTHSTSRTLCYQLIIRTEGKSYFRKFVTVCVHFLPPDQLNGDRRNWKPILESEKWWFRKWELEGEVVRKNISWSTFLLFHSISLFLFIPLSSFQVPSKSGKKVGRMLSGIGFNSKTNNKKLGKKLFQSDLSRSRGKKGHTRNS